jgi:hypothetical protein
MKHVITPEEIDRAEKLGACSNAITWLRKRPRTDIDLYHEDINWWTWGIMHGAPWHLDWARKPKAAAEAQEVAAWGDIDAGRSLDWARKPESAAEAQKAAARADRDAGRSLDWARRPETAAGEKK